MIFDRALKYICNLPTHSHWHSSGSRTSRKKSKLPGPKAIPTSQSKSGKRVSSQPDTHSLLPSQNPSGQSESEVINWNPPEGILRFG